jgi:hypothetical protein
VTLIYDHHRTEDDVMYPFLAARFRTFHDDLVVLHRDHVDRDPPWPASRPGCVSSPTPAGQKSQHDTQRRLVDNARVFNGTLIDHLDREERRPSCPVGVDHPARRPAGAQAAESKLST